MDYAGYTKSGKLITSVGRNLFKFRRASKIQARQRARNTNVALAPNERLTYNVNVYLGNYKLEKCQIYYLVITYKNDITNNLSAIYMESNRLKILSE